MIRVVLPFHLRTLAHLDGEVTLEVEGPVTPRSVLDALEARYPVLCGTIRDHVTKQRRPFLRFFACEQDLSHESPDTPLPDAVASGAEPFIVLGAVAGGWSREREADSSKPTQEDAMSVKVGYSTPMLHVAELENSIRFYELLGFATVDTDRCQPLGWARLHCDGGAVMFLRAEEPVDASAQAVMLCMYTPDLIGLREHLLANGLKVPAIQYPPYMPSGEITLTDPDGYRITVAHWGKAEQEAWEKRLGAKAQPA